MIEHFTIFTKSGFVLWQYCPTTLRGNPVNELIKVVLLEERGGLDSFPYETHYILKWTQSNESDLVFVVVYQKNLPLNYIDELLLGAKQQFVDTFGNSVKPFSQNYSFDKQFQSLLREMQSRSVKRKEQKAPAKFENSKKATIISGLPKEKITPKPPAVEPSPVKPIKKPQKVSSPPGPAGRRPKTSNNSRKNNSPEPTKRIKKKRIWEEDAGEILGLGPDGELSSNPEQVTIDPSIYGVDEEVKLTEFESSISSEEEPEDEETPAAAANNKSGGLLQFFTNICNKELSDKDLEPVLAQFTNHLISKNVASEIAEKLCASVKQNLVGKQLGTFSRVSTTVRESIETALTRILTPKRQIDVLREARAAKEAKIPYVIVFVGVNGVGKSTSLAKVCSWLLQNDLKVMIAACDTYRAGAVEQLQVHGRNLGVEVHHKGYGKDPAAIATEAIKKAKISGIDVVLIDTAGRMQDNEPLMRSLAKLVGVNQPQLVLFVGEALVGNEAVDQLTKFNRALEEFSMDKNPRGIDGIFLTKFDTVDEKVGAAISMVYATGQPIVFIGIGQKYSDVKVLNVPKIVSVLLKGN